MEGRKKMRVKIMIEKAKKNHRFIGFVFIAAVLSR